MASKENRATQDLGAPAKATSQAPALKRSLRIAEPTCKVNPEVRP